MPEHKTMILGARKSPMAVKVAEYALGLLKEHHPDFDIRIETFLSDGCKIPGDLKAFGGKGTFVKDLERRLLAGEIDCAIHALKDVPGDEESHPDLELFCFLEREDPRDALIMRAGLAEPTADDEVVLATSAPRRQAILRALYPRATIIPLRGNVDTRFKKLQDGTFDGMVLSYAGLQRLDLAQYTTRIYEPEVMLPAIGQGVLCLQVRKADAQRCTYLRSIHSSQTEQQILAERSMLNTLGGNCHSVIAGHCTFEGDMKRLRAFVADEAGQTFIHCDMAVPHDASSTQLGYETAKRLLAQGADRLIEAARLQQAG